MEPSSIPQKPRALVSPPRAKIPSLAHPGYHFGPLIDCTSSLFVRAGARVGARSFRRPVTLVALRPEVARIEARAHSFTDTAALFAKLGHDALMRVEDVAEVSGIPFAVSAPLAGSSVAKLLAEPSARARALSVEVAVRIVSCVAKGVAAIHGTNPRNRAFDGVSADSVWVTPERRGLILPSALGPRELARYRAPELERGDEGSPRSDVYALALLLWDLLALGRSCVPERIDSATSAVPRSIDPALVRLVLRSLAADPTERPESTSAFDAELAAFAERSTNRPVSSPRAREPIAVDTVEVRTEELQRDAVRPLAIFPPPVRKATDPVAPRPPLPRPAARTSTAGAARSAKVIPANRLRTVAGEALPRELVFDRAGRWVVGRARSADLVAQDQDMSREHFEIVRDAAGICRVYDLGSKNGLFVNGAAADDRVLSSGDEVQAGTTRLRFET